MKFAVGYNFCILILLICVHVISSTVIENYRVVKTKSGEVRGIHRTTILRNIGFYAFKGIPYAKPPIGELRFKVIPAFVSPFLNFLLKSKLFIKQAPEPIQPWSPRILDAFNHSKACVGQTFLPIGDGKDEDCLSLNIYVPSATAKPDNKLPVMFWIHGGAFLEFSGNEPLFGPDFLIEQNVILVTINYR